METIKESFVYQKQISRRLDGLRRSISWRALPVLMILGLLVSMIGLNLPAPALAVHEGEETAGFLPADTELYLTANLDPGLDQLIQFWSLFNYWWQDSDFQDEVEDSLGELEDETGINIEEDVLPWLGPEIAVGVQNINAGGYQGYEEAARTERDNVQLAVVAAMAEVPTGTLDSGGTIDGTACTVTYDGGTLLPVGDYIVGGIASLSYSYYVEFDGAVEATSGPLGGPLEGGETGIPEEPEFVIFVGTTDKEASDTFFEDQFIPNATDETGTDGTYNGIEIIYFPGDGIYCAFTDDYIIISNNQDFLESTLDIILDPDLASLADDAGFQQCRNALPTNRVGMLYCKTEQIWDEAVTGGTYSDLPEGFLESFDNQIPPCFAASISFAGNGISMSAYCPLPDGAPLPSTEPYSPHTPQIVPGDAILLASGQDANPFWEEIKSLISDNWEEMAEGEELPSGVSTFEDMIDWIDTEYGIDVDTDIFGWMTGECSVALLSLPTTPDDGEYGEDAAARTERDNVQLSVVAAMADSSPVVSELDPGGTIDSTACTVTYDGGTPLPVGDYIVGGIASLRYSYSVDIDGRVDATSGPAVEGDGNGYVEQSEIPDVLIMFEVEDTTTVDGHLDALIDGINTALDEMGESDLLETSDTTIDGVNATQVTNDAITESGASPGWLFLDVDSTHYLVIGTTTDALTGAVDASQGDIPSLDEAEGYQGVQSLLPGTVMSLGYIDLAQIFDNMVFQMSAEMLGDMALEMSPSEMMGELGSAEFDMISMITSYFPSQCAVGWASTLDGSDGIVVTGAIYIQPPPLVAQPIGTGTLGTSVKIAEQTIDFSQLDPDVGKCAVSMDVDINGAPAGASIELIAVKDVSDVIASGFALAAEDAGLSIKDIAYVIRVDKTNLTDENVGTATITMKVSKTWAEDYGTGNVKIIRISDGTQEVLPTTFTGYEGDYAVFEGVSENGLSHFGLAAVSSTGGTNWALIGGIIGAILFVIIVFTIVIWTRRKRVA